MSDEQLERRAKDFVNQLFSKREDENYKTLSDFEFGSQMAELAYRTAFRVGSAEGTKRETPMQELQED